jgi:hypothetical protein
VAEKVLLVDFENVGKIDLAAIERMVDRMIGDQKLAESAGKISYRF